jgi:hypothetical protein
MLRARDLGGRRWVCVQSKGDIIKAGNNSTVRVSSCSSGYREAIDVELSATFILYFAFPGTKIHENVIRMRKPTAMPIVPAVPTCARMARPAKAPKKSETAAMRRWSRVRTRSRKRKRRGSDMSSTQTVVNTTVQWWLAEIWMVINGKTHW